MGRYSIFKRAEFVTLHIKLRFSEYIVVDLPTLLRLRRALRSTAQYCFLSAHGAQGTRFNRLFSPELAADPVAQRQFQKSGPAFVFDININQLGVYQKGDQIKFDMNIWGGDLDVVSDFVRVVQALGQVGLRSDAGRFEMFEVCAKDSSSQLQRVWSCGESLNQIIAPVRDGQWWLNSRVVDQDRLQLQFTTPARLIVKNRPMFNPSFKLLFPFILRRVTSMLYTHCGLDLSVDSYGLLSAVDTIEEHHTTLNWNDWRQLQHDGRNQPLGGVEGEVELRGTGLIDLCPYLYLGSLMNVGKNASFGAGNYRVSPAENTDGS